MQMRHTHILALLLAIFLLTSAISAVAQDQGQDPHEYYTIDENQNHFSADADPGLNQMGMATFSLQEMAGQVRSAILSLLHWTMHDRALAEPADKYNRKQHFGRWINDPNDDTCYNTRAKVLVRDSDGPVAFKDTNHCVVVGGDWHDAYTGNTFTSTRDIQIDHVVPLKNAYMSGAWEWNFQTRCLYANFLGNSFHLLSVSGTENMRKGDSAPDQYLPPNTNYRCQYLESWLKIKLIWRLKMTPSEVQAIRDGVKENHCNVRDFSLSERDLKNQRDFINANIGLCPGGN